MELFNNIYFISLPNVKILGAGNWKTRYFATIFIIMQAWM